MGNILTCIDRIDNELMTVMGGHEWNQRQVAFHQRINSRRYRLYLQKLNTALTGTQRMYRLIHVHCYII